MKTTYHLSTLLPLLAAALLAGACSQTELEPDLTPAPEGKLITLTATHGDAAQTRLAHEYNGATKTMAVKWTDTDGNKDAFKLYRGGKGEVFTITDIDPVTGTATFSGKEPEYANGSGIYMAYYPAHRAAEYQDDVMMSLLGQQQNSNDNTAHLGDYNFMQGWFEISSNSFTEISDLAQPITFINTVAILRITVPAEPGYALQSLTMAVENEEEITVGFGTNPVLAKNLTLTFTGTTVGGEVTAYLTVFTSMLSPGNDLYFSATFKNDSGTKHLTSDKITIGSAGQFLGFGNIYNVDPLTWDEDNASVFSTGITAASTFGGSGDYLGQVETNPYLIQNAAQLKKLVDDVANQTGTYGYGYFKLTTDIHVTAGEWIPIGDFNKYFYGNFDGGGHTISGLLKAATVNPPDRFGFFGYTMSGSVKNLHVAADIDAQAVKWFGGIVGSADGTEITNCTMSGKITSSASSDTDRKYAGGIVGSMGNAKVENCVFHGSIDVCHESSGYPFYAGGIVGYVGGGEVTRCTNKTPIDTGISTGSAVYLGGIVGRVEIGSLTLKDCLNEGNLSFGKCSSINCGGLVGIARGSVTNSRNLGNISGTLTGSSYGNIGGLVGYLRETTSVIETSFNGGAVNVSTENDYSTYVGSLLGYLDSGDIYSCNTNAGTAKKNSSECGLIGLGSITATCPTHTLPQP